MFSERCNLCKSCLIRSSQVILGLPLLLLPSTSRVSITLTGSIVCLLFTCPNHLNLPSFIFAMRERKINYSFLTIANYIIYIYKKQLNVAFNGNRVWITAHMLHLTERVYG
ncbi:hypothetical protein Hanom_Chr14g01307541 [Helianthus anomalus]